MLISGTAKAQIGNLIPAPKSDEFGWKKERAAICPERCVIETFLIYSPRLSVV